MKNYLDGGEAILEAFRKLKVDYIMSSPGSEWSPVWEALARQKLDKKPGPDLRGILARDRRRQYGKRLHLDDRPPAGRPPACRRRHAAGEHGRAQCDAERSADGGDVGRVELAGRRPRPRHRAAMVWRAHRRRHRAVRRTGRQVGARGNEPLHALRKCDPRRRNGTAHSDGSDLSQRPARTHAARLDAARAGPRGSGRAEDAGTAGRRAAGRRHAVEGEESGRGGGDLGSRSEGLRRAGRTGGCSGRPGDRRPRHLLRQLPDRSPALYRLQHVWRAQGRRPRPARGRTRALVSGAPPADQRQDRADPREPA